jgi:hypothetical protein
MQVDSRQAVSTCLVVRCSLRGRAYAEGAALGGYGEVFQRDVRASGGKKAIGSIAAPQCPINHMLKDRTFFQHLAADHFDMPHKTSSIEARACHNQNVYNMLDVS